MVRQAFVLAVALGGMAGVSAQVPPTPLAAPTFEVASVKRSAFKAGDRFLSNTGVPFPGGRWSALNTTVSRMVQSLYEVQREQIVGGPAWFDTELFVIDARAADTQASREQIVEMAKRLLAERFNLRLHVERRPLTVSALVVATEGRLGPGLRPTVCVPRGNELPSPRDNTTRRCGTWTRDVVDGVWQYRMSGFSLDTLMILHRVEVVLGASVVDRTGLSGLFDIDIAYVPDPDARTSPGFPVLAAMVAQLGLTIERRRELMDVLVIDSVAVPTPN